MQFSFANLRQSVTPYGGNSYATRQNSVYISTGLMSMQKDNSNTKSKCIRW